MFETSDIGQLFRFLRDTKAKRIQYIKCEFRLVLVFMRYQEDV